MTFLAPLLLWGLPLAALPIIIHLIHLHRRRTVPWAAMMFLLAAQRMNKGFSRLRQWLILAFRVLAIAALIFVVTRPLAGGWLGLTGGMPDTVIVLLDRSASMEQQNPVTGVSKRRTGLEKLTAAMKQAYGRGTRLVLLDSATGQPTPLDNADALLDLPTTSATDAAADIPALLQGALDYITANQAGRTDVWLLSDLRQTDWDATGGRWEALRGAFITMQGVRFHLLSYPQLPADNLSVTVEHVTRRETSERAELLLDVRVTRREPGAEMELPLRFTVNGATTTHTATLRDTQLVLQGHSLPVDKASKRGWGRVEIPGDANTPDNVFYFVFDEPPVLRSVIVSDDAAEAALFRAALEAPADSSRRYAAAVLPFARAAEVKWEDTALVVWHAPIPAEKDVLAKQLQEHAVAGRSVLFAPPDRPDNHALFGLHWGAWHSAPAGKPETVQWWRNDAGLLANARDGSALPVGELELVHRCEISGEGTPLARVGENEPLLMKAAGDQAGSAWLLGTLPGSSCSTLARDGVVFFAMLHRALQSGSGSLGKAHQRVASRDALGHDASVRWQRVGEDAGKPLFDAALHAGVLTAGDKLVALNRPASEDRMETLGNATLDELFAGLDFRKLEDTLEDEDSLVSEVWRTFLIAMALLLLGEALLCLPAKREAAIPRRDRMTLTSQTLVFTATPLSLTVSIGFVLAVTVLAVMAWRRSARKGWTAWLETLRVLIAVLIAITLNQPEWREIYEPDIKPRLAVLTDVSHSMDTKDVLDPKQPVSEPKSRAEAAKPLAVPAAWEALQGRMEVVQETFSSRETPPEEGTDLNAALDALMEKHPQLGGVVLASDGDWNTGSAPAQAATRLRMRGVPVFAVPIGAETRLPDVELVAFDVPAFGVAGKPLRIPFAIESSLPREETATLTMKVSTGEIITKDVVVPAMGRLHDSIAWKPEKPGDVKLTLSVPKIGSERYPENNALDAALSIRKEQLRVLVIESVPRWEYRYLRNALERDPGVEVNTLLFLPGLEKPGAGRGYLAAFPKDEALTGYDVIFLGDVGMENKQLTDVQCTAIQKLVRDQAAGLVFLPGLRGYQATLIHSPLSDLMPVVWDEAQPGGWGSPAPGKFVLTEAGTRSLLTKLEDTDEASARVWSTLPGFQWYAPALRAKAGTEVLATHGGESTQFGRVPLIVTKTYGAGKILFMGADGAWRWRRGVEDKYHYRFWGQVVRWMAYQRNMAKGDKMRLFYSPDRPKTGSVLTLNANVMTSTGEPLRDGNVVVQIVSPSGKPSSIRLSAAGEEAWGLFSGIFTPTEPGEHKVTLSSAESGSTLESTIAVQGTSREKRGQPARYDVLKEIAQLTRGQFMPTADPAAVVAAVAKLPAPEPQERRLPLWAHPVWAGVIILLLGIFWAGRKAAGAF